MFDIGWGEPLFIGIVALIAIGPKELPTVLRTMAQYMARSGAWRRNSGQFRGSAARGRGRRLKKTADEMSASVTDFTNFDPMANARRR